MGILLVHPERFTEAYEAESLGIDFREMPYGKQPHIHRILFAINGSSVNIH